MTGESAMSDTTFTPDLLRVIHPLDDAPEQKLYHAELGSMAMTATVRVSLLLLLRAYLAGMVVLVMWRVLSGL
jgi:hypothetical protein